MSESTDFTPEQIRHLALPFTGMNEYEMALHILKYPQPHVNALVEAGVLRCRPLKNGYWFNRVANVYYVDDHVHDWAVTYVSAGQHDETAIVIEHCVASGCPNTADRRRTVPRSAVRIDDV